LLKGLYSRFKKEKLNSLVYLGVNTNIIQHLHERNNSMIETYLQRKEGRYYVINHYKNKRSSFADVQVHYNIIKKNNLM
jgi:hypothetical protein